MKVTTEIIKGRYQETKGILSGNDKLRRKGETYQAVGHARQTPEKGVHQAEASARKRMDQSKNIAQKTVDQVE